MLLINVDALLCPQMCHLPDIQGLTSRPSIVPGANGPSHAVPQTRAQLVWIFRRYEQEVLLFWLTNTEPVAPAPLVTQSLFRSEISYLCAVITSFRLVISLPYANCLDIAEKEGICAVIPRKVSKNLPEEMVPGWRWSTPELEFNLSWQRMLCLRKSQVSKWITLTIIWIAVSESILWNGAFNVILL